MTFDKECDLCGNKRYIQEDNYRVKCKCLIEKEIREYLTPMYLNDVKWFKRGSFDTNIKFVMDKKPLLKVGIPWLEFKKYVKSFLLNTGCKYSHETVSPEDVFYTFFHRTEDDSFERLKKVDILILNLASESNNKEYSNNLLILLEHRANLGLRTWIHDPEGFKYVNSRYSKALQSFIDPIPQFLPDTSKKKVEEENEDEGEE